MKRFQSRLLAILTLLGVSCFTCDGTVVLVTITKDAIYVGADGRLAITRTRGDGKTDEIYDSGCKIHQIGKITVAYSGQISSQITGFDVWALLNTIQADTVAAFANASEKLLKERLSDTYAARAAAGIGRSTELTGDIAFSGFDRERPAFVRIMFAYDAPGRKVISVRPGPDEIQAFSQSRQRNPAFQSRTVAVGKLGTPAPGISECERNTVAATMRCEIEAYIKADPDHVNEPIAIRKITAAGSSWIEKGACQ